MKEFLLSSWIKSFLAVNFITESCLPCRDTFLKAVLKELVKCDRTVLKELVKCDSVHVGQLQVSTSLEVQTRYLGTIKKKG